MNISTSNSLLNWKVLSQRLCCLGTYSSEQRKQVSEYLLGKRKNFRLPDIERTNLTSFQKQVLTACAKIPYGRTVTYSEIAQMAGAPKAVRAVGTVMAKNPFPILIPCHRVVAKSGKVSYAGGSDIKQQILRIEQQSQ